MGRHARQSGERFSALWVGSLSGTSQGRHGTGVKRCERAPGGGQKKTNQPSRRERRWSRREGKKRGKKEEAEGGKNKKRKGRNGEGQTSAKGSEKAA